MLESDLANIKTTRNGWHVRGLKRVEGTDLFECEIRRYYFFWSKLIVRESSLKSLF